MAYEGTGAIHFKGRRRRCSVSLEPEEERIIVRFPVGDAEAFSFFGKRKIFDRRYKVEKLSVDLPYGRIRGAVLRNLLLTNASPGTLSIYDSTLVRAFSLYKQPIGLAQLSLVPAKSIIRLPVSGLSGPDNSELVFRDNRLPTKPHIITRVSRTSFMLTGERILLIVRSNHNLLKKRETITRAIGLMQGGKTLYRAGYFGSEVELNFVKQGQIHPLGPIYEEGDELGEFFSKYLAFERSLSGNAGNRHKFAMDYLIDGCAGLPLLEHKAISLFISLEIIDGSKTLNKNTVRSTLSVPLAEAELIVGVRNSLVHEGSTLYEAIEKTRVALQKRHLLRRMPFKVAGVSKSRVAFNFHIYLLDKMLAYVATTIGMTSSPTAYRVRYS